MKAAFIDIPAERTTAATDALLALLSLGCGLYLLRLDEYDPGKAWLWTGAFGLLALSAGLGAIAHGFNMSIRINTYLWQPLNLILGLTVALFVVGVTYDLRGPAMAQRILPFMMVLGLGFYAVTRLIPGTFLVFIVYQTTAMFFALGAYGWLAISEQLAGAWLMTAGVLVTIIGAGIQTSKRISFTLIWEFDYNGVYHLIQMVGVGFITAGLRVDLLVS
ncbi:MAG: hypothetical protein JXM69_01305 [Anaerolineae bacterium]|nr:hypothetical protein [Anaerolineae bacterium]